MGNMLILGEVTLDDLLKDVKNFERRHGTKPTGPLRFTRDQWKKLEAEAEARGLLKYRNGGNLIGSIYGILVEIYESEADLFKATLPVKQDRPR